MRATLFKLLKPLFQANIIYCMLKHCFSFSHDSIHWPFTFLALAVTSTIQLVSIYSPLTDLTCSRYIVKAVGNKSSIKTALAIFPYLLRKIKGLRVLKYHLAIIGILISFALALPIFLS